MSDAREIARQIAEAHTGGPYFRVERVAKLADAIDEALRNEREWISVETRLPNLGERVLAWYVDSDVEHGWATDEIWTMPDLSTCRARGVSHWKPFAPPTLTIHHPKGKGQ